jgi:hypothetical protein
MLRCSNINYKSIYETRKLQRSTGGLVRVLFVGGAAAVMLLKCSAARRALIALRQGSVLTPCRSYADALRALFSLGPRLRGDDASPSYAPVRAGEQLLLPAVAAPHRTKAMRHPREGGDPVKARRASATYQERHGVSTLP